MATYPQHPNGISFRSDRPSVTTIDPVTMSATPISKPPQSMVGQSMATDTHSSPDLNFFKGKPAAQPPATMYYRSPGATQAAQQQFQPTMQGFQQQPSRASMGGPSPSGPFIQTDTSLMGSWWSTKMNVNDGPMPPLPMPTGGMTPGGPAPPAAYVRPVQDYPELRPTPFQPQVSFPMPPAPPVPVPMSMTATNNNSMLDSRYSVVPHPYVTPPIGSTMIDSTVVSRIEEPPESTKKDREIVHLVDWLAGKLPQQPTTGKGSIDMTAAQLAEQLYATGVGGPKRTISTTAPQPVTEVKPQPPTKGSRHSVYDVVATLLQIDVLPYIKPKHFDYTNMKPIGWTRVPPPAPGVTPFVWSETSKSGYLKLENEKRSLDARYGNGWAFGTQGFANGVNEWVYLCEMDGCRMRCGVATAALSAFPVEFSHGMSRHKIREDRHAWLSNIIVSKKGMEIRTILDMESEQNSVTIAIDGKPYFVMSGFSNGLPLHPGIYLESGAVTAYFEAGTTTWWSLNGAQQEKAKKLGNVSVMDVTKVVDNSFRSRFRQERRNRVRERMEQSNTEAASRARTPTPTKGTRK